MVWIQKVKTLEPVYHYPLDFLTSLFQSFRDLSPSLLGSEDVWIIGFPFLIIFGSSFSNPCLPQIIDKKIFLRILFREKICNKHRSIVAFPRRDINEERLLENFRLFFFWYWIVKLLPLKLSLYFISSVLFCTTLWVSLLLPGNFWESQALGHLKLESHQLKFSNYFDLEKKELLYP